MRPSKEIKIILPAEGEKNISNEILLPPPLEKNVEPLDKYSRPLEKNVEPLDKYSGPALEIIQTVKTDVAGVYDEGEKS